MNALLGSAFVSCFADNFLRSQFAMTCVSSARCGGAFEGGCCRQCRPRLLLARRQACDACAKAQLVNFMYLMLTSMFSRHCRMRLINEYHPSEFHATFWSREMNPTSSLCCYCVTRFVPLKEGQVEHKPTTSPAVSLLLISNFSPS